MPIFSWALLVSFVYGEQGGISRFHMIVMLQIILWVVVRRLTEIAESRKSWNSHKLLVCGAQNGNVIVSAERPQ